MSYTITINQPTREEEIAREIKRVVKELLIIIPGSIIAMNPRLYLKDQDQGHQMFTAILSYINHLENLLEKLTKALKEKEDFKEWIYSIKERWNYMIKLSGLNINSLNNTNPEQQFTLYTNFGDEFDSSYRSKLIKKTNSLLNCYNESLN